MRKINLKSVVWKEGDYYISQCLEVDVSSFGKTKKEALKMLQEALELYFEDVPFQITEMEETKWIDAGQLEKDLISGGFDKKFRVEMLANYIKTDLFKNGCFQAL